jgi:hypothetical protein
MAWNHQVRNYIKKIFLIENGESLNLSVQSRQLL